MTVKYKTVLLILLFLFSISGISAEEKLKETSTDSETVEYTLPEIVVKGDNSMHSLRMEVIHAEELKFEVFNNLNSTDEFDITCEWHAYTGTRIKQWRCDVGYMRDARADDVRDWMDRGVPMRTDHQLAVQLADKTRALNKEMRALAARHPELAIAMINAHELQQLLKAEHNRRYKDSILVGQHPEPKLVVNKIDIWSAAFLDHRNGAISDEIWARWDNLYRKLFRLKSYQSMWKSANYSKYDDDFVAYVNTILAGG